MKLTSAWPVMDVLIVTLSRPFTLPPPCVTVNVTGRLVTPLHMSFTHARNGSGAGPPASAFWLLPVPILIWCTGPANPEAQKVIVPAISLLVTETRLLARPASAPTVHQAW